VGSGGKESGKWVKTMESGKWKVGKNSGKWKMENGKWKPDKKRQCNSVSSSERINIGARHRCQASSLWVWLFDISL